MIVKNISWISKSAEDAEIEITDGEFTCIAFSQPCTVEVGDHITDHLHVFSMKNAMITQDKILGIWKISHNSLEQKIIAEIVDLTQQIIAIGKIFLVIDDYLPGGLSNGNTIEFQCSRIDLW